MTDMLLVQIFLIIYFAVTFVGLYMDWRKGQLKLSLKRTVNGSRFSLTMIWSTCLMIIGLGVGAPLVTQWQSSVQTDSPLAEWFILRFDSIFVFTILILFIWMFKRAWKPWWGYTEEERKYMYESEMKTRAKLPSYLKWLYPEKKVKV